MLVFRQKQRLTKKTSNSDIREGVHLTSNLTLQYDDIFYYYFLFIYFIFLFYFIYFFHHKNNLMTEGVKNVKGMFCHVKLTDRQSHVTLFKSQLQWKQHN